MKPNRTLLAAGVALILAMSSSASAAPSVGEAMQTAQYLVGTWNCAYTVGDFSGTYVMSFAKGFGERWLWQYVLPGTSGSVTWTKKSDTEYAMDGPEYPQNGKLVTEHHICRKST